ncbi:MAG: type II secretion system F family protein [Bryobacterales bacterium]|nr:type II secretion system F family protein [Bryobacterales bacterium]
MTFLVIALLIFSGTMFLAAYYVFSVPRQQSASILNARLREIRARAGAGRTRTSSDLILEQKPGAFAFFGEFLSWIGPMRRLQEYIDQANLTYRAGDVLAISVILVAAVAGAATLFRIATPPVRLLTGLAAGIVPVALVVRKRNQRLARFEEGFPDAIDLFNRSMRAGHNIHAGLETLAQETADPIRMEFKKVVEELSLGSQLEPALHNLGTRIPIIDLKFFITGLILQRQTGANMVSVLENLSVLVRERLNLAAKMRAATTQQRFSAGLLCLLPIVVGIGFWFVKPEYVELLFNDETGSRLLTYAVVSEIIGVLIIRKVSNMKY